jgi:hypothetical protein
MSAISRTDAARTWQPAFLALLPAIERQTRRALQKTPPAERDEARQAILSYAAVAFARLFELDKAHLAYPAPLVGFGLKHYRAGRLVGGCLNSKDVGSTRCRRRRGCFMERLDDWKETLVEARGATPAELAALRIDFSQWLESLSSRDRQLANELARGESTSAVAKMFQLTAGRVSQLRRELHASWLRFVGEPMVAM